MGKIFGWRAHLLLGLLRLLASFRSISAVLGVATAAILPFSFTPACIPASSAAYQLQLHRLAQSNMYRQKGYFFDIDQTHFDGLIKSNTFPWLNNPGGSVYNLNVAVIPVQRDTSVLFHQKKIAAQRPPTADADLESGMDFSGPAGGTTGYGAFHLEPVKDDILFHKVEDAFDEELKRSERKRKGGCSLNLNSNHEDNVGHGPVEKRKDNSPAAPVVPEVPPGTAVPEIPDVPIVTKAPELPEVSEGTEINNGGQGCQADAEPPVADAASTSGTGPAKAHHPLSREAWEKMLSDFHNRPVASNSPKVPQPFLDGPILPEKKQHQKGHVKRSASGVDENQAKIVKKEECAFSDDKYNALQAQFKFNII